MTGLVREAAVPTMGRRIRFALDSPATLLRIAVGLIILGALWRTVRYLLQFPIWGDEAMLVSNLVWLGYRDLLYQLDNGQIAPILFLWAEKAVISIFGSGELAVRLVPFVAGMASLALFVRMTGLVLRPHARLFAIAFLAVASWPVMMATLAKPYAGDLFMSLLLSLLAIQSLQNPTQSRWLMALTAVAPVAILSSYPSVFVGGAVSLALARTAWRGGWTSRCWLAAFNVAMLAGFAFSLWVGNNQLVSMTAGESTRELMNSYWAEAYPPSGLFACLWWFIMGTSGQMMAYPVGSQSGGSTVTLVLCVVGIVVWRREKKYELLALFVGPLLLNLLAAFLHRYPYGASGRLNQHLAPGICILAGVGLSAVLSRSTWSAARQWRATWIATALFVLVGVAGMAFDIVRPYRDTQCLWMRTTMNEMRGQVGPAEPVIICGMPAQLDPVFAWYWANEPNVTWNFDLPAKLESHQQVWAFLNGDDSTAIEQKALARMQQQEPAWQVARRETYDYTSSAKHLKSMRCALVCFERPVTAPD